MKTYTIMANIELTDDEALSVYNNATLERKIELLQAALSFMESDNSRGKQKCIIMAVKSAYKK